MVNSNTFFQMLRLKLLELSLTPLFLEQLISKILQQIYHLYLQNISQISPPPCLPLGSKPPSLMWIPARSFLTCLPNLLPNTVYSQQMNHQLNHVTPLLKTLQFLLKVHHMPHPLFLSDFIFSLFFPHRLGSLHSSRSDLLAAPWVLASGPSRVLLPLPGTHFFPDTHGPSPHFLQTSVQTPPCQWGLPGHLVKTATRLCFLVLHSSYYYLIYLVFTSSLFYCVSPSILIVSPPLGQGLTLHSRCLNE